jgi:hypothetical protein
MGSPRNAVVMKRGPSLLQGMMTPTWQTSVKGALAQLPAGVQAGLVMRAHHGPNNIAPLIATMSPIVMGSTANNSRP